MNINIIYLNLIFLQITVSSSTSFFTFFTTLVLQNIWAGFYSAALIYPESFANVFRQSRIGPTIFDAATNQVSMDEIELHFGQSINNSMMELNHLPLENLASVDDFEEVASQNLNRDVYFYFHDGSGQQITSRNNRLAYEKIIMKPRVLVGVENRRLDKKIFGKPVSFPFGTSPTALQKLATAEGELANARGTDHGDLQGEFYKAFHTLFTQIGIIFFLASEAMGTIFTLSVLSNARIDDVAKATPKGRNWANVFIFKNSFGNFGPENGFTSESEVLTVFYSLIEPRTTWNNISWIKKITKLPVLVKGILSPEDADLAVFYKVDGLFVSNHGGRQLDSVSATIDVLPEIVRRVAGRCLVIVDGGVTNGLDIFKGLALGADMVFAGRPLVWGLAVGGEKGAKRVLQLLKDEFNLTMAFSGVRTVQQISPYYVQNSVSQQSYY